MNYTKEDCIKDTKEHIGQVREFMIMFANEILQRALVHDHSKLESPEVDIFTEFTPKLKNCTYGSDEYKIFLKEMQVALKHHYENNSHHPEHYKKYVCNSCFREYVDKPNPCHECYSSGYSQFQEKPDIKQMNLMDIVEMICDWKAASLRHEDGDIERSITINKDRFNYSDDLDRIFRNTVKLFN